MTMRTTPAALFVTLMLLLAPFAATAQAGRWAEPNDPVANQLIEAERGWAVDGCGPPSELLEEIIADDFVGTSPKGPTYTKAEATERKPGPPPEFDCKLLSARVRFFGPSIAIIYGSETASRKGPDGKEIARHLVWTDTWLKRNGKWQIIAVQDMTDPRT